MAYYNYKVVRDMIPDDFSEKFIKDFVEENFYFNPHVVLKEFLLREGIEFVIDPTLNLDILR
jgi:hypothetical protein